MPQSIEAGSVNIDIKVLNDDEYIETYFKTNTNSHFQKYKNVHLSETCVIMGTGPTLKQYNPLSLSLSLSLRLSVCLRSFSF